MHVFMLSHHRDTNGVLVLKGLLKELIVICDSESLKVLALWSFPCEGIELGYFRVLFRVVVAAIGHKVKLFIYWYSISFKQCSRSYDDLCNRTKQKLSLFYCSFFAIRSYMSRHTVSILIFVSVLFPSSIMFLT